MGEPTAAERITALERRVAALEIERARRVVAARLNSNAMSSRLAPKGWRDWLKFWRW